MLYATRSVHRMCGQSLRLCSCRYIGVSPLMSLLWRERAERTPEMVPYLDVFIRMCGDGYGELTYSLKGLLLRIPVHEQDRIYQDSYKHP